MVRERNDIYRGKFKPGKTCKDGHSTCMKAIHKLHMRELESITHKQEYFGRQEDILFSDGVLSVTTEVATDMDTKSCLKTECG